MAGVLDSTGFFRSCAYAFKWSNFADKTVMDIGCGKGNNSTKTFVELYPDVKRLIGIELSANLISIAQEANRNPNIEFHVADVLDWSSLSQWEGQIDVIISYYCFNCVDDKKKAFENVYRLMAPGGTAALAFTLHADIYEWAVEVGQMYSEYSEGVVFDPPESHTKRLFASHYQEDLAQIGFEILKCEDEFHQIKFPTDKDCKIYLSGACAMASQVPIELVDKFLEDIFLLFLEYRPRDQDGSPFVRYRIAKVLVRKRE